MRTILIIEDSAPLAFTWRAQLEPLGHQVLVAEDGRAAFEALNANVIDCVLLDLMLPDMSGMDILAEVRARESPPAVVIVTANASLTTAVQAVRAGAFDYLVKPFSAERIRTTVENSLANTELRREVETLRKTSQRAQFGGFVGRSLAMQTVYRVLEAAAPSTASVFITGESGTGKELAAEALHSLSPRRNKAFVPLNCGAIPQDLLESTIFGHRKGAFTGAIADQEGAAARADGGTLFLDELGEMPMPLQTKLLRFIQTGTYQPVGHTRLMTANIRFVAATNRDPEEAIRQGTLREDLFYRLHVVPVVMPPLRERGDDILLIARHFLLQFAKSEGRRFRSFAPEAEAILLGYNWPGNVRQLQNIVRNVTVLNQGEVVTADMLPPLRVTRPPADPAMPAAAPQPAEWNPEGELLPLKDMEQRYIEQAIRRCGGNIHLAARRLGVSPSTIYRKKESWEAAGPA
ncbi:sigma-54-dependent Fis family transcriptional regulator [Rhodovarius crocodyli]|uniref:Sigma-54-dependent Fis family transcriptional regulator n=1 Tax=Rhodovarius crocodyli TaxID=1979269 RepID=A0A437MGK8_9PROT|nr:sigma-54 dependent transcriptional regulator [Rhodovarius crocodyli]RVT96752.1 sigma-54-dependent Fis family transcriptional regulator [Rhodovarius crocodyli]